MLVDRIAVFSAEAYSNDKSFTGVKDVVDESVFQYQLATVPCPAL